MNSLPEKMCMIEKEWQTSVKTAALSAFIARASTTKSRSLAIKTSKPSGLKKSTKDN
jgi:cytochrome bd-type quinol oxidase subunit 1